MIRQLPYGEGIFRRRIRLTSRPGAVLAELEDDFHHLRVTLWHDGTRVTDVGGELPRYPWTTCPEAAAALRGLRNLPLSPSTSAATEHTVLRTQCAHMLDLASLAVVHAAAGRKTRLYDVQIPDRVDRVTRATLFRDGEQLLAWTVSMRRILSPPPFAKRAFGDASPTQITLAGAADGQCLNDGAIHAADLASFVCMPPLFSQMDMWFGLPGPATSGVSGSVRLSP